MDKMSTVFFSFRKLWFNTRGSSETEIWPEIIGNKLALNFKTYRILSLSWDRKLDSMTKSFRVTTLQRTFVTVPAN